MRVIRVLEKNTFSFTAAQLPLNQTASIPVAVNIDTSWAVYGSLVLRAHSFSVGAGAGTAPGVKAFAYFSAPTAEDPATLYRTSTAAIAGSKISGSANFAPSVTVDPSLVAGNMGGWVDVVLDVIQWSATAGNLVVAVSIDLVLKD